MPMHRCIQSAAGGTSQRLKLGPATVRSFARISVPPPLWGIAPVILDICIPPVCDGLPLVAAPFYLYGLQLSLIEPPRPLPAHHPQPYAVGDIIESDVFWRRRQH